MVTFFTMEKKKKKLLLNLFFKFRLFKLFKLFTNVFIINSGLFLFKILKEIKNNNSQPSGHQIEFVSTIFYNKISFISLNFSVIYVKNKLT